MTETYVRCAEKEALLTAYHRATQAYSQVVSELIRAVDAAVYSEYELIRLKAAEARQLAHRTHQRLEDHEEQHGC